jgi:6-pyruvoyltetrahydropterin/6-carboxytetrahydropterin synthase
MNSPERFKITIRKEALKFSAAHMTVFPDGTKESLHGHNYRTELSIEMTDCSLTTMLPFSALKAALKSICEEWDEKVLLPAQCPFFRLVRDEPQEEIEFILCGKRYVMPRDEAVLLPMDNVLTETLARELWVRLRAKLAAVFRKHGVHRIWVRIEETEGQGVEWG